MNETINKTRSRAKLLILATIGFGPLLAAYAIFFYFPYLLPSTTTNNGELIDPPIVLNEVNDFAALNGLWSLMLLEAECGADCTELSYLATQVVKGLGKDSDRVRKVLLLDNTVPSIKVDKDFSNEFKSLKLQNTRSLFQISNGRPGLFLKDPNGNVILFYPLDKAGKPMLKDLKHLLKLSNIG